MQRVLTLNQALVAPFAARPGTVPCQAAQQPPVPATAPAHGRAHVKRGCAQATSRDCGTRCRLGSPMEASPDQADCNVDSAADAACTCACHICKQSRHALQRALNVA